MADDNINQCPHEFQEEYKNLIKRMGHIMLLIMQLNDELLNLSRKIQPEIANNLISKLEKIKRATQQMNYDLRQQVNE